MKKDLAVLTAIMAFCIIAAVLTSCGVPKAPERAWADCGVLLDPSGDRLGAEDAVTRETADNILMRLLGYGPDMYESIDMNGVVFGGDEDASACLSRENAAAMLAVAFGIDDGNKYENAEYSDEQDISESVLQYIKAMTESGYLGPAEGRFRPADEITVSEFASMLDNMLTYYSRGGHRPVGNGDIAVINNREVKLSGSKLRRVVVSGSTRNNSIGVYGAEIEEGIEVLTNSEIELKLGENSNITRLVLGMGSTAGVELGLSPISERNMSSVIERVELQQDSSLSCSGGRIGLIDAPAKRAVVYLVNTKVSELTVSDSNEWTSLLDGTKVGKLKVVAADSGGRFYTNYMDVIDEIEIMDNAGASIYIWPASGSIVLHPGAKVLTDSKDNVNRGDDIMTVERFETDRTPAGSGTEEDPYLIRDLEELYYMGRSVTNPKSYSGWTADRCYRLETDIELPDPVGAAESNWYPVTAPIGFESGIEGDLYPLTSPSDGSFSGTFDGNGKTISNLVLGGVSVNRRAGMFDILSGTVKDLTVRIKRVNIWNGNGGIIACYDHGCRIENCTVYKEAGFVSNGVEKLVNTTNEDCMVNCVIINE